MQVLQTITQYEYEKLAKKLKSETGYPISICMSALSHSNYDVEKSKKYLQYGYLDSNSQGKVNPVFSLSP